MKRCVVWLSVILMCLCLSACKSEEVKKTEEAIQNIGPVTAQSGEAIDNANRWYESLSQDEKAEVENFQVLIDAQAAYKKCLEEERVNKVNTMIREGDCIEAYRYLQENPDIQISEDMMEECESGVIPQYIRENGEEKDQGVYFLSLKDDSESQVSVWYYEDKNQIILLRYELSYGIEDAMTLEYTLGSGEMRYTRTTAPFGTPSNYQEGKISLSEYTGTFTGTIIENDPDPMIIHGLTVTASQTAMAKQTRGYCMGTMHNINDMLESLYAGVVDAGYVGTMKSLGFTVYTGYSE